MKTPEEKATDQIIKALQPIDLDEELVGQYLSNEASLQVKGRFRILFHRFNIREQERYRNGF